MTSVDYYGNYTIGTFDAAGGVTYSESGAMSVDGQNFTITVKATDGEPLNPFGQESGQGTSSGGSLTLVINDGGKVAAKHYVVFPLYDWEYFYRSGTDVPRKISLA